MVLLRVSSLDITSSIDGQVMSGTRGAFLRILRHICSYLGRLLLRLRAMLTPVVEYLRSGEGKIKCYYTNSTEWNVGYSSSTCLISIVRSSGSANNTPVYSSQARQSLIL